MSILTVFDILGTIAFAISGALAAMNKRLDIFGVLILAFVTAVGGGTLRDVLIGYTPVAWMRNYTTITVILGSYLVVLFAKPYLKHLKKPLFYFDSFGLGAFTITGIAQGMAFGLHPGLCVALGTMTGAFGGVIRDILINEIPHVFRKEIYATACIIGGVVFFLLLSLNVERHYAEVAAAVAVVVVRIVAIRYHLYLPKIYDRDQV
ncbi:trimeric intracellular cation channel family protein [Solitalea lacus]|uniref:trimeric intracellular cation channel family protein n=1 Tax=Solitalea lacus TaxID=2911172 RepID=UPI001EDA0C25|nr:trimeric intracellular cation channel family protein [Solitalea lacus]UKJ08636.1 trimeric intracellular cation channel family protein [Solitalea lacus]